MAGADWGLTVRWLDGSRSGGSKKESAPATYCPLRNSELLQPHFSLKHPNTLNTPSTPPPLSSEKATASICFSASLFVCEARRAQCPRRASTVHQVRAPSHGTDNLVFEQTARRRPAFVWPMFGLFSPTRPPPRPSRFELACVEVSE